MIEIVTQPPMKIEPLPVKDWRDQPETPGAWRWALVNGQSTALFIGADEKQIAMLKCDPAKGTILLARPGVGEPPMGLMVRTTSMAPRLLSASERPAALWIGIQLPARDPLLDAIAFSRGRFALELLGQDSFYIPAWPEVSRVIEDCR